MSAAPQARRRPRVFDWRGALLNAGAFGLVVTGVDGLGGDARGLAVAELAAGLAFAGLLVRQQLRQPAPMLPLDRKRCSATLALAG